MDNTVVPRNSGLQNSGLPLSSGQFLGDQLFVPFLCSNSPLLVDSLSSGHFLGKRLSDFCNKCGFFCWFLSHLAFHLFNACSKCDKAFSQKTHLKKQEVIHTGQKPHACSKCDKTFTQKAYLKTQELIHTGKKPHVCSKCDKTFTQKGTLKTYELIIPHWQKAKCLLKM